MNQQHPYHWDDLSAILILPNIKLGSIKINHNNQYFTYLQPLCDSVRLSIDTSFLLLEADVVNRPNGKIIYNRFDLWIVIKIGGHPGGLDRRDLRL